MWLHVGFMSAIHCMSYKFQRINYSGNVTKTKIKIKNLNIWILEFSFFYSKTILLIKRKTNAKQNKKKQINK